MKTLLRMVTVTVIQQLRPTKQLTDTQKLVIDMYFNDGHTQEFLIEFFLEMYPNDSELVKTYLHRKFQPKMVGFPN